MVNDILKKKIFVYETLNAEKEIQKKFVSGPFKKGKDVIIHVKSFLRKQESRKL